MWYYRAVPREKEARGDRISSRPSWEGGTKERHVRGIVMRAMPSEETLVIELKGEEGRGDTEGASPTRAMPDMSRICSFVSTYNTIQLPKTFHCFQKNAAS